MGWGIMIVLQCVIIRWWRCILWQSVLRRKSRRECNAMLADLAVGDSVVTTGGFYGIVIIDITDEDVIVEFGSNKNCRIPMKKAAIAEVEKARCTVSAEKA